MDLESPDINIENLQRMPYSELRKLASKFGIQRMKADKLVSAIMSKVSSTDNADNDMDCFSTPAAKLINSSKKNKEKVFDENQRTPLETPRRGTFTVETPSFVLAGDLFATLEDSASVLDESNVTFSRGSERKLRSRKVSFMSPIMTPRTPRSQSLRNRPKTPIATRTPLNETDVLNCNSVEPKRKSPSKSLLGSPEAKVAKLTGESDVLTENVGRKFSTPLPSSVQKSGKRVRLSRAKISPKNDRDVETENVGKNVSTPVPSSVQQESVKKARLSRAKISPKNVGDVETENVGKNFTPLPSSVQQESVKSARLSRAKISPKNVADVGTENVGKNVSTPLPSSVQQKSVTKACRPSRAKISPKNVGAVETENVGKNVSTPLPSSVKQKSVTKAFRPSRAKISPKNGGEEKATFTVVNSSTPLPAHEQKLEKTMNISRSKISLNNDKGNTNRKSAIKEPTSLKKKQTPNFKRIHQKAFDKMESIDDYQKRKMLNSAKKLAQHSMLKSKVTKAKSKIPAFSGIPFLSSLDSKSSANSSGRRIMMIERRKGGSKAPPMSKENVFKQAIHNRSVNKKQNLPKTPLSAKSKPKLDSDMSLRKRDTPMSAKSKSKFDLKQSLSKKLNYKPHRGPLKPLSAANTTVHSTSILPPKEPVQSKAVIKNRSQNRSLIRGVRMNKRFELQMKNRKLD